jgi:phage shock protein C
MSDRQPARKLYRSRQDRFFAGVCGGIGEYFNIDPTFVRILFVGLSFVFLSAVVVYIIMWLIVPEQPL